MDDNEPRAVSIALQLAADAARSLTDAGTEVVAAYANGRRPVLIINAPPTFVRGHVKRKHPNALGGVTEVYAAGFQGCQLEWMRDIPGTAQVQAVGRG